jgi:uncharacterized protein (TIGR02677 family)
MRGTEHGVERLPGFYAGAMSDPGAPIDAPAPNAPTQTGATPGPRASFAERVLDGAERAQLTALRAATAENAPVYLAVLAVLAEAARAYRLQCRTSEIRDRITSAEGLDVDETALRSALDQLREWRCVDWVQDPQVRAASIEEYLKRHELWELTPTGVATLEAADAVLGATAESGALQRTMFRQIRSSLDALAAAVAAQDDAGVYLHLRGLDAALAQLATNAREFYATINRIAREERLEDHVFLVYKDQLIDYLQSFHDDLVRNRSVITGRLAELDGTRRDELLALAAAGDDSAGLFEDGADWTRRWDGMLDWFIPGRAARSEVDALAGATTVAIRELLSLLRRLTEQATRPVNWASELRETAAWFAAFESDAEAHRLFDAAFGLEPVDHLGFAEADAESDGRFPSWWDLEPVEVPMSLRAYGRRPARGATGRRNDYSQMKQILARERAAETRRAAEAAERLVSVDLSTTRIGPEEWPTLLRWLDQALAARPAQGSFHTTVTTADALVTLSSADHDTRLCAPEGDVVVRGCAIEVRAA